MNIFDVHVNRIPFTGIIEEIAYSKGRFISANLDKASDDNERNSILLRTPEGEQIFFIQIAGFIARRIVCWVNKGNRVTRGARFGLICFGSRLELFLPTGAKITVKAGERVKARDNNQNGVSIMKARTRFRNRFRKDQMKKGSMSYPTSLRRPVYSAACTPSSPP